MPLMGRSPLEGVEKITVVIPAAGRVPEGVLALSNIACPAMIPVCPGDRSFTGR